MLLGAEELGHELLGTVDVGLLDGEEELGLELLGVTELGTLDDGDDEVGVDVKIWQPVKVV